MKRLLPLALLLTSCREAIPAAGDAARPPNEAALRNAAGSAMATAEIGPFAFRYDPEKLAPAEATIGVPPDWREEVRGLKLVARDRVELLGKAECMYGLSGQASRCTADMEAGLAFALVDRPYEELKARIAEPPPVPVALAGRQGISWEIGAEGEGADHVLLPADGRTLLIVRQHRTSANPDPAALQAALDSLSVKGSGNF